MDAPPTLCPSEEELRLLCQGKADPASTDRFLQHLESCPLCPDRADAIWKLLPPPFQQRKAASTPKDPTPLLENPSGIEKLLDRADLERIGITFLPRSTNPLCLGRLGEYDLHRVIGTGGMGIVFQATTGRDNHLLALKTLKLGPATSLASRERFLREARALQAVRHPGLVPVLATGEDTGIPFFVMPLLEGHNFERLIARDAPLPLDKAVDLARQAVEALAAAHAAGLVHRDIKPSNLWLEPATTDHPFGRVRLLDFGLAQIEAEEATLTSTGVALGTPAYLSPEQAEGTGRIGPASDLFSFGCVLYEMLVGSRVFPGATAMEIFRNIAAFKIAPPSRFRSNIPPRLEALTLRLLAHNPRQRPVSAANLLQDLNHPDLLRQPNLNRRHLLAATAAAALGAGGFAIWRSLRPVPLTNFQPFGVHPLPGAVSCCEIQPWAPGTEGPCVAWVEINGGIRRQALNGSPPEILDDYEGIAKKILHGISTLGVCGQDGVVRFLFMDRDGRVYWTAPRPEFPTIPERMSAFSFNLKENRYLVAVGQTVRVWETSGTQVDVYAPRCRAQVSSIVPCPPTLDKGRHFAVTMTDGTLGFLNETNLLMYQETLLETPMDFRLAIRDDSVEAAVWDQSGRLAIWQADSFIHRSRLFPLILPLDGQGKHFSTLTNPCKPLSIHYLRSGKSLLLLGECDGQGHAWVVDSVRGQVIGRLGVNNPREVHINNQEAWLLDADGNLNRFTLADIMWA